MEGLLETVGVYLWQQSWHLATLVLVIGVLNSFLRNRSAHVRYMLWLIVLAKCLVPPIFSVPVALLPAKTLSGPEIEVLNGLVSAQLDSPATIRQGAGAIPPLAQVPREGFGQSVRRHWLVTSWGVVASLFCLVNGVRVLRIRQRLHRQRRPATPRIQEDLASVCGQFGLSARPHAWLLDDSTQPFVWGWCKGAIYLPREFGKMDRADHRQAVLAHELCHVCRRDPGMNLLQLLAQCLFWFHPFVWWANSQIRKERERCCDEMVIGQLGTAREEYCHAILHTLRVTKPRCVPLGSLSVAASVRNIEERIKVIMKPNRLFHSRATLKSLIAVVLLAALAVPSAIAITRQEKLPAEAIDQDRQDRVQEAQIKSRRLMNQLSKALLQYAKDHEGRYPVSLGELWGSGLSKRTIGGVEYFGQERMERGSSPAILAYDKVCLAGNRGTYVLFEDCRVDYLRQAELTVLGISGPKKVDCNLLLFSVPLNSDVLEAFVMDGDIQGSPPYTLATSQLDQFVQRLKRVEGGRIDASPRVRCFEAQSATLSVHSEVPFPSATPIEVPFPSASTPIKEFSGGVMYATPIGSVWSYMLEGLEIEVFPRILNGVLTVGYQAEVHRKVTDHTRHTATAVGVLIAAGDHGVLAPLGQTSPTEKSFLILKAQVVEEKDANPIR